MRGSPASGLVVYGALAEAVRRESNQAVVHWFGVAPSTVSLCRRALDVRPSNPGTHRLRTGYGAEPWFATVRAKGRAARWTAERRADWSARTTGRTYGPDALANIRAGLKRRKYQSHPPEVRAKM